MGRAKGSGNVFDAVIGRASGIPTPIMPTENIGIMSGAIRPKAAVRKDKFNFDKRGSRRGRRGGMMQVTMKDPKTGQMYGGLVKDGVPKFEKPDFVSDEDFKKSFPKVNLLGDIKDEKMFGSPTRIDASGIAVDPVTGKIVAPSKVIGYPAIRPDGKGIKEPPKGYKYDEIDRLVPIDTPPLGKPTVSPPIGPRPGVKYSDLDPSKPSAVQETTRVNVQDPTLGGPPEREVPIPKEKDMTPRGPAPFAPNEGDVAKQRFFETMFERAANRRERREIESAEDRDIRRVSGIEDRERGGRRRGRRDFTRRRPERRRSREERAQFRDRYVSTLGGNFFS